MGQWRPTGEGLVGAASNGEKVLDDVLAVGGLSTPTLAQQNDGLILSSGEEVPVGCLGCAVDVRGRVLPPAALKHLHHLGKRRPERAGNVPGNMDNAFVFIQNLAFYMRRLQLTFSEYMEGELMGLITTMLGPAWVCTRLLPYRCRSECITLDSFKYCREARSSTRSDVGGFAWNVRPDVVASVTNAAQRSCDD